MRWYTFYIICRRDLINLLLNPVLLMYNSLFPLLLIATLGYLGEGTYGGGEVRSYDYYSVTLLIFASLNVSVSASNSFMEKSIKTTNLRIMFAPIPNSHIYLSKILATFLFSSLFSVLHVVLLHHIFGIEFGGGLVIYFGVLLVIFNLFSSALGVFFCCLFKSEELSNSILSLFNNVFALAGGLFFSWDGLGRTAEMISYISPVKWVADAAMRVIYDYHFVSFYGTMLFFVIAIPIVLIGCKLTFKTEDYV